MKLELKHLAGYLPYKLPIKIRQEEQISREQWKWFEYDNFLNGAFIERELKNITPILRPLSDLIKEIEVNGEKFVPIDVLNKTFRSNSNDLVPYSYNGKIEMDIETENYSQTVDLMDGFYITQKLLEWHFDIYNLIENNLAIDKNTLL